jgi:hypothetical protein
MNAKKKRAQQLEAKGNKVEFKELLRIEPKGGTTNIRDVSAHSVWIIVAWSHSPRSRNATHSTARRSRSGSRRM